MEYRDKRSPSIYVAFPVKDGKGVLPERCGRGDLDDDSVDDSRQPGHRRSCRNSPTPSSEPGNVSIFWPKSWWNGVMKTVGIESFERVGSWKGSELEGSFAGIPSTTGKVR